MSDGLVCDACGAALLLDSDVRYIVEIRGYAAYDPMEITREDLKRDVSEEMRRLLADLAAQDPRRAEDEVHKEFRLDLCPTCWRRYIRDPLADNRPPARSGGREEEKKSQGN